MGVLLERTVGAAKAGDAPVLIERRWNASHGEGDGHEQQQGSPTERAHLAGDSGRNPCGGQAGSITLCVMLGA
jgi:hypothetical protein